MSEPPRLRIRVECLENRFMYSRGVMIPGLESNLELELDWDICSTVRPEVSPIIRYGSTVAKFLTVHCSEKVV